MFSYFISACLWACIIMTVMVSMIFSLFPLCISSVLNLSSKTADVSVIRRKMISMAYQTHHSTSSFVFSDSFISCYNISPVLLTVQHIITLSKMYISSAPSSFAAYSVDGIGSTSYSALISAISVALIMALSVIE